MAGSNIFFKSKHSLGIPIGSGAMEITWAGRIDVGSNVAALVMKACCEGADPFVAGTPRAPTTLEKV